MANDSNFTTFIPLNNQPCMNIPTLINLNLDEYNQRLGYYPFMVNLDRCNGNCKTLEDTSGWIYVPNRTADLDLNVFNITGKNESKTLKNIYHANVNVILMVEHLTQV